MNIKTIDIDKEIQYINEFFNDLSKNSKACNDFFHKTGFYTKKGNLKKKYKTS